MTSLGKLLNLSLPIVQSPMAGISTVKMAATVTNNGGLGSIPFGALDVCQLSNISDRLTEFNSLTGNYNVNLNFFCHEPSSTTTELQKANWKKLFSRFDANTKDISFRIPNTSFKLLEDDADKFGEFIDIIACSKPSIISFHFGLPKNSSIKKIQNAGSLVFVSVTSLQEAKLAFDLGIDGVICQGYEAGGHRGNFLTTIDNDTNLSTQDLFDLVIEAYDDKYVIPAGGIMDSTTIKSYLDKKAAAVQMGTIFLFTGESTSNPYIQTIDKSTETCQTFLVSGKLARCIKTKFIQELTDGYESSSLSRKQLPPYGASYDAYKGFKATKPAEYGFYLAGTNWTQIPRGNVEEILKNLNHQLYKRQENKNY